MSTRITLTKAIDTTALSREIEALNLPNFKGVMKLERDIDANGRVILDDNRKPVKVPPYLLINADPLTGPQRASVQILITNHVIPPIPPTRDEVLVTEMTVATAFAGLKAALIKRFS